VNYLLINFTCDVNMMSLSRSWHWWAATASAAYVTRLVAVADRSCDCRLVSWLEFNAPFQHKYGCIRDERSRANSYPLTQPCDFNLFSLYPMNFMHDTTFDAVGNILRVPYTIRKSDVSFSQGSVSTLFRWSEHVLRVCV